MDKTRVKDALVQVALRMVPIVPANEMKRLFEALTAQDSEIDKKVAEAIQSLNRTSSVIAQLEESVRQKTSRLEKLQIEYKKYEHLTALTQEQVRSISNVLQETIERNRTREIITTVSIHLGIGCLFLILGVILAQPIEGIWHSLFASSIK